LKITEAEGMNQWIGVDGDGGTTGTGSGTVAPPAGGSTGGSTGGSSSRPSGSSPSTGDSSNLVAFVSLAVVSLAGLAGTVIYRKRTSL
jgi:LPXTG-motif cell wall-anchored protein